jgi:hypothetical protein
LCPGRAYERTAAAQHMRQIEIGEQAKLTPTAPNTCDFECQSRVPRNVGCQWPNSTGRTASAPEPGPRREGGALVEDPRPSSKPCVH